MDSKKQTSPEYSESDGDVGLLLYKTGHALKQFFIWIGKILSQFGQAVISLIVFLFRNAIWLLAGTLIGLGYGYFGYKKQGDTYTAQMSVKANFNSTRSLYNTIEYLNSLIAANKTDELSKIFGITEPEADRLIEFSCTFIESEIITAEMYKQQFMQYDHKSAWTRVDTFWLRTIEYGHFKEELTKYDYPYHEIGVKSTNSSIFSRLEKGIVNYISRVELLQEIKDQQLISNNDEEKILTAAIQNIDTLRRAYNLRLSRGESTETPGVNQLTFLQSTPEVKTPELQLYDKLMDLLDQLKKSRIKNTTEKDVIEVLSSFNPIGKRLTFLQQNGTRDILAGLAVSIIILSLIATYKELNRLEKSKRVKRSL